MATSTPRFSELIRLPGARYGTVCCPKGIAIQTDCTVLVTDPGSNCIWKIDGDLDSGGGGLESDGSTAVTVFAGCPGQVGHADGPAKEALFESPEGIAICSDGTVYVGDIFSHDEDGRRMRLRAVRFLNYFRCIHTVLPRVVGRRVRLSLSSVLAVSHGPSVSLLCTKNGSGSPRLLGIKVLCKG